MWPIAGKFPLLKTLVLRTSQPSIPVGEFAHLPSSLTRFGLVAPRQKDSELCELVRLLPRHLQSLELWADFHFSDAFFQNLPPTLVELAIPGSFDRTALSASHIGMLPRTITSISKPMHISPLFLERVPPLLREITVRSIDIDPDSSSISSSDFSSIWFRFLPRHLTYLDLSEDKLVNGSSNLVLADLPPTITALAIPILNWSVQTSPSPQFPPLLSTFDCDNCELWTEDQWKLLPHNGALKTLTLASSTSDLDVPFIRLALVPRSVTSLKWDFNVSEDEKLVDVFGEALESLVLMYPISPSIIPLLPRGLKQTSLAFNRAITLKEAKQWPNGLQMVCITLGEPTLMDQSLLPIFSFPPSLTDLSIKNLSVEVTRQAFAQLSRNLKCLFVEQTSGGISHGQDFSALPPRLTAMRWAGTPLPPTCLEYLPSTLTNLNLYMEGIQDEHMQHLPAELRLLIYERHSQLTSKCIPFLPPHLKFIFNTGSSDLNSRLVQRREEVDANLETPDPRVIQRLSGISLARSKQ